MGLFELIADMLPSFSVAEAEAPAKDESDKDEEKEESGEEEKSDDKESGEEEEEKEEEPAAEEEEEEEEPEDIKPALEEECANSKECSPHKHHYDECVERVTKKIEESENGKSDEDCVEEFFHLAHCASNCAAPKLFKALK